MLEQTKRHRYLMIISDSLCTSAPGRYYTNLLKPICRTYIVFILSLPIESAVDSNIYSFMVP